VMGALTTALEADLARPKVCCIGSTWEK